MLGSEIVTLPITEAQQALFIFDGLSQMSSIEPLIRVIKSQYVHIIVLSMSCESVDKLMKEIDQQLIRGCKVHNIQPLSSIHSTQRIVHSLMKDDEFTPTNSDQQVIEKLAEYTTGSPVIVDVASQVVYSSFHEKSLPIQSIGELLSLNVTSKAAKGEQAMFVKHASTITTRSVSENVSELISSVIEKGDVWSTNTQYDSWDSVMILIDACGLTAEERLLLNCISVFTYGSIPFCVVTELALQISKSSQKPHLAGTLHSKLMKYNLVCTYPYPVVLHSSVSRSSHAQNNPNFMHVPQCLSQCIWKHLTELDRIAALTLTRNVLSSLHQTVSGFEYLFCATLCSSLLEAFEFNFTLVDKTSYQTVYNLFLSFC